MAVAITIQFGCQGQSNWLAILFTTVATVSRGPTEKKQELDRVASKCS
jgi:hypothetical protein